MKLQEFICQLQAFEVAIPGRRVSFQIDRGDDWNALIAPLAIVDARHAGDADSCMLTFFDQLYVNLYHRRQARLLCEKRTTATRTTRKLRR